MFMKPRSFLALFSGAFFGNLLPKIVHSTASESKESAERRERAGKGKGRRTPPKRNAAIHKRAAKKAKGRALNKARHA